MISLFAQELDIKWDLSQILPYRSAKTAPREPCFRSRLLTESAGAVDSALWLAKSSKN
jgi:hypothetical protein